MNQELPLVKLILDTGSNYTFTKLRFTKAAIELIDTEDIQLLYGVNGLQIKACSLQEKGSHINYKRECSTRRIDQSECGTYLLESKDGIRFSLIKLKE